MMRHLLYLLALALSAGLLVYAVLYLALWGMLH